MNSGNEEFRQSVANDLHQVAQNPELRNPTSNWRWTPTRAARLAEL
ncbi:hypothetical protein [Bradyrhizobium sp. C-145]|nr:hypothetical protein [Bradyrhizobium sp. C-145]